MNTTNSSLEPSSSEEPVSSQGTSSPQDQSSENDRITAASKCRPPMEERESTASLEEAEWRGYEEALARFKNSYQRTR